MTAPRLRALVVAGAPEDADLALRVLLDNGDHADQARDVPEALSRLAQEPFEIALVSLSMPRGDGLALVHHLRALYPDVDVVAMAGPDEIEEAGSAMALGVLSMVVTPLTGDDVLVAVDRARERRMLIAERAMRRSQPAASPGLSAAYAACAAFVAESDPVRVVAGALSVCEQGAALHQAGAYLPAASGSRLLLQELGDRFTGLPDAIEGPIYEQLDGDDVSFALEGRLYVPLRWTGKLVGALVFATEQGAEVGSEMQSLLAAVGPLASASLGVAGRVSAVSKGGIRDPDTGAYTFAYFGDVASRELDRAVRHHRAFALVTLELGGMDGLLGVVPNEQIPRLHRVITEAVLSGVRVSDVVARRDDRVFLLLLPETGLLGALACRRRILERIAVQSQGDDDVATWLAPLLSRAPLTPTSGISVFPGDGSDLGELIKLSRRRSERAREGVWRTLGLDDRGFWDAFDALVAPEAEMGPLEGTHGLASRAVMPLALVAKLADNLIRDAARDGLAGTLYLAGDAALGTALARAVDAVDKLSLRTWILGPARSVRDPAARFRLPLTDARLNKAYLLLYVTERGGYCLAARASGPGELTAFHSSDLDIVEGLVSSLQSTYHLQPELR